MNQNKKITLICLCCGKTFQLLPCQIGRGRGKFCSKICYDNYQKTGDKIVCFYCKKEFYRAKAEQDIGEKNNQFCSKPCYFLWRKETIKKNTYEKNGSNHVHRIIVEKNIGRKLQPGEIIHHVDGNKHNNDISNLMLLPSQAMHAKIHFGRIPVNELSEFFIK